VSSIPDSNISVLSAFWCRCLNLAKVLILVHPCPPTTHFASLLFHCGSIVVDLYHALSRLNLPNLEPILCFLNCSDDIFNTTDLTVTEQNKAEYVNLLVRHRLFGQVKSWPCSRQASSI
jgi:hypothetical protein